MNAALPVIYTIAGLMLFEIVTSVDNAIINAEILSSLPAKNRHWFLNWGLFCAVVGMRGLLPWILVWLAVPSAGIFGPFAANFTSSVQTISSLHASTQALLMVSGTSLLLIFLYWLVIEHGEQHHIFPLRGRSLVFIAFAVSILVALQYGSFTPQLQRASVVGVLLFVVLLTTKRLAMLPKQRMSLSANRRAKVIYLEVLDSIFSIEAVLGAFAFTFSVPLILVGNGLGAIIVRHFTAAHGKKISHLHYLKRGAMYAIGFLGVIMLFDSLGIILPGWLTFLTTLIAMGLAYIQG